MKTRGRGSTSKETKPQKETIPEMDPSVTPPVPVSTPSVATSSLPAASIHPDCRPKTTARKNSLALQDPEGSPLIGVSNKGVTFSDLNVEQNLSSSVPLALLEGPSKQKPSPTSCPQQFVSTEVETNPSTQDSESSLYPNVLTPKAKGKRKSKVANPKQTKKTKVAQGKGTSNISDSTPLSKFKTKAKINPLACTSSEYVSSETQDSLPELDPTLTETIHEEPQEDPLLQDSELVIEYEEDPLETTHVASNPKEKKPLAFPELFAKSTKHNGAPIRSSCSSFKAHSITFCFNGNKKNIQFYEHRHFISEHNFHFSPHRVFGVLLTLEERGWLRSLSGFEGYVPRVVKEFYANLNDELFDHNSFMFHMVYVRGHWYKFSFVEILKVLNLVPDKIDDSIEFAKDQVFSELVGQAMVWESSASLRVSDLTHYYGTLFKFSMFNWIPTTHSSTITQDITFLLFKIGNGVTVGLASAIYDQILSLSGAKRKGKHLMFDS
ncbi:uncharacterized protein LOC133814823 [Humulus lupulus]|uniref:uncharacterized protein LOC133814823 n=1 Tax=Humulus lupulus TaxID=3486 RepID=UPI002B40C6CB|nr:uncharacterized protein LOC133814823 [Humulus lupulus]